jgi:capsular polysaccharide biosynthesis protein
MLKIFFRWWWLALIPIVVVVGYVGLTYRQPATTYQVVMRFTAGGEPSAAISADYDRYYAWLSSEYIANALADVAVTGRFAEAVAARLSDQGLTVAPGAIQGAIAGDNAQSIFVIYLTWPNPEQIIVVAEAISAELTQNATAYFPQIKGVGIAAQRVDPPTPVTLPPSLRAQLLGPGLRIALALAVGLGLVALAHYFDPLVRERVEVEQLDVRVLAAIPKQRA